MRSGARKVNRGWRLDYFIVSNSMKGSLMEQEIQNEYYGSDHCPLRLKFDTSKFGKADGP